MSDSDYSRNGSDDDLISEDSQRPEDTVYPLNEEVEVPHTNGQLFKTVLTEGTGRKPAKGSKVSVHYVGTLLDGTEFDSSRKRGSFFEFQLSKGQVIKGWDVGVATMKVGEKCILRCLPDYAYGAQGHPPTIPPSATLNFEVELFSWTKEEDISQEKNMSLMKRTLLDGVGMENPSIESKMTMNVSIYAGGTDEELDALVDEQDGSHNAATAPALLWEKRNWNVEIGDTVLPPHLEECVKKMRKEEVALFRVAQEYIPSEGVSAFNIPCCSSASSTKKFALLYKVEILSLSTIKTWDFKGMEKVEQGMLRKNRANAFFQSADYARAITFYRRALEFIGEDYGFHVDEEKKAAQSLRVVVWGNLCQALLLQYEKDGQNKKFTQNPKEAITLLDKALALEPSNIKNLFRLSKAQHALKDWDASKRTLEKLLSMDASNAEATALLAKVKAEIKDYDKKQKSLFSKMFA